MTWDLIVLAGWFLAVARVTRFVIRDELTESARIWFMHRKWHGGPTSLLAYFVNCSWCISMWVAMFSTPVAVYMAGRTWPQAILLALGASYFTGMMSRLDNDDVEIEVTED